MFKNKKEKHMKMIVVVKIANTNLIYTSTQDISTTFESFIVRKLKEVK